MGAAFDPASFSSAHGICVDRHGDIYLAEVAETALGRAGKYREGVSLLKKFMRRR